MMHDVAEYRVEISASETRPGQLRPHTIDAARRNCESRVDLGALGQSEIGVRLL